METAGINQWTVWLVTSISLSAFIIVAVLIEMRYRQALRNRTLETGQDPTTKTPVTAKSQVPPSAPANRDQTPSVSPGALSAGKTAAIGRSNDKKTEPSSVPEATDHVPAKGLSNAPLHDVRPTVANSANLPDAASLARSPKDHSKPVPPNVAPTSTSSPQAEPFNLAQLISSWRQPVTSTGWAESFITSGQGLVAKPIRYSPHGRFSKLNVGDTYPVTEMPVAPSISAGTVVGRPGPAGYSESAFHGSLMIWFKGHLRRDDRMKFIGASRDYEPDIILHFEDSALRIDIEIDEPYSGSTRKPMHWLGSYDDDRDLYFTRNGWVVIRFAEIQVMQQREACIKHVAQVIDSLINTDYAARMRGPDIVRIPRWSHAQATQWAKDHFRESYLNVEFERRSEPAGVIEAEQDIVRTRPQGLQGITSISVRDTGLADLSPQERQLKIKLEGIINADVHARFLYDGEVRLVKPARLAQERARHWFHGHDLVLRENQQYELRRISDLQEERKPYVRTARTPTVSDLNEAVLFAMDNQLYMQMTYVNYEGEVHQRTVSQLAFNNAFEEMGYRDQHIIGYCTFRKEERTFRIDRIREYAILNLSYAHP